MSADSTYAALIVTYKRPHSLRHAMAHLLGQSISPGLVVVCDNDPNESGREVVEDFSRHSSYPIVYQAAGTNLGPAGGWAQAWRRASSDPHRGTWVAVLDDDDPATDSTLIEEMLRTVARDERHGDYAAIGLRGASLSRWTARLRRVFPLQGTLLEADYLGGNGVPLYRWVALDEVGFFDASLFFGFEDLDLGLRLRAAGWKLGVVALPESSHQVLDTSPARVPWREYYKMRAMTTICLRHVGLHAAIVHVTRSGLVGSMILSARTRDPRLLAARISGAFDGFRGRLGKRRYDPASNPAKPGSLL